MLQRFILALVMAFATQGIAWADIQVEAPDVHVGDLWHFRTVDGFTNETTLEFTHRVVEVNDREIVVQLKNKNAKGSELRYYNHEWNSVDSGDVKFYPFYPAYKFPMSVGGAWKQEYRTTATNGKASTGYLSGKVVAFEKVTVPAGVFDAYKTEADVETQGTDANANITKAHRVTWYAPAIKNYVRIEITTSSDGRVRSKNITELVESSLQDKRALPVAP